MHSLTRTIRFCALLTIISTVASARAASISDDPQGGGIQLAVTLSADTTADSCGTATELAVDVGQQVNFCYVLTNTSATTLNYHILGDDVVGPIIPDLHDALAPGASYRYNRFVSATSSQSPTTTWTAYSDLPVYTYDDTVDTSFVDITATGTPLDLYDDEGLGVTLDFPFQFYGFPSNQITISNNGGILFGTEDGYLLSFTSALPDADIGAAILPYWTNIADDTGNVYYATVGESPNRQFIVEWYDRDHDGTQGGPNSPSGATFEVVLYENGNGILFNYQTTGFGESAFDDGATATVGLNGDATHATQYSYDQAVLHDGLAILFTPTFGTIDTTSQQVVLDVGAPAASVSPTAITASVVAGESTTVPLTIGNAGDIDLAWHFGQPSSRAHFPAISRPAFALGDPQQKHPGRAPGLATGPQNRRMPAPFAAQALAFGFDESNGVGNGIYVGFDTGAPQSLKTVGPSPSAADTFAGDFVGNDFSVEYTLDTNTDVLYAVSTTTAAASPIATMTPPVENYDWTALRWDASTATAYSVLIGPIRRNPLSPWYSNLYTVDLATGASVLVGPIQNVADPSQDMMIIDIAVSPDGLVYGLDLLSDSLMAIDKASGAASVIGSIGFDANNAQSMDFDDASGVLYLAGCVNDPHLNRCVQSNLYTVDTSTGLASLIAPLGSGAGGAELGGFAIASASGCSSPDAMSWLSFDPSSGTAPAAGSASLTATLDASALAPGSYAGTACLFSNDPNQRRMLIPVALDVAVNDTIFANGFEL
jgi:hypothetical protein